MARSLGRGQLAECMRSGTKCRASELVRDGRNPELWVLPEWYDPPHPAEKPFVPSVTDGQPRHRVAPERLPRALASALDAFLDEGAVVLLWLPFDSPAAQIASYKVFRAVDDGDPVLLVTVVPVSNLNTGVLSYGSPYTDTAPGPGVTHTYFVRGTTVYGAMVDTDPVTVEG